MHPDLGLTLETLTERYTEMFANLLTSFFDLYPVGNDTAANTTSNDMSCDLSRVSTWDWAISWYTGGAESKVYVYYFTHAH